MAEVGANELAGAMPVWTTPFFGRGNLIADIARLLDEGCRLVTLVGIGGVGKTRLAVEAVGLFAGDIQTVFVPLATIRNHDLVLPTIAAAVRAGSHEDGPLAAIVAKIGAARTILVLDSLERLLPSRDDLARLLVACPNAAILATSRLPLGIAAEVVIEIVPLPLPEASRTDDPEPLAGNPAVQLFLDRMRAVRLDAIAGTEELRHVAAICERLEGIPLALELAAARTVVLPPEVLLARLVRRLPLLVTRAPDRPDRLRTMRGTVAWSYDLLTPDEQALFRRLSVFEGGFSLSAAETMAAGWSPVVGYPFAGGQTVYPRDAGPPLLAGKEPPQSLDGVWLPRPLPRIPLDAVDGLEVLAAHRLIRLEGAVAGEARYAMLETIREFGWEELDRTGEAAAVDHARAACMVALAEAAGWGLWGADRPRWLARLEADLPNLRAAIGWLAAQPAPATQLRLRLVDTMWQFWFAHGRVTEGRRYLDDALAAPGGTMLARANAANTAAYLALIQGDRARAGALLGAHLPRFQEAGFRAGEARCRFLLALVAWAGNDHAEMVAQLGMALPLFEVGQDHVGMGVSLIALSVVARRDRRLSEAESLLTSAAARFAATEFHWGLATCAYYRGELRRTRGEDRAAAALLLDGLARYRDQGDPVGMAGCLSALACIAATGGALERAARLFAASGKLGEEATGFLPPTEIDGYRTAADTVRSRLGDKAFYAASAVGYTMPLDHILAEAARVGGRAEGETALTPRQLEVVRLLAGGLAAKEIAARLGTSQSRVYQHLHRARERLRLQSEAELVAHAVRHEL